MNGRYRQIFAVYASGILVGISLIIFPSAGPLFTDPEFHNLSSAQFGILFTPQIVTAIASSLLTATVARRLGMKRVLQYGLSLSTLAMLLLAASELTIGSGAATFVVLLAATAAIGAGFGFTISALNAYAFDLFPGKEDSAVTAIHVATGAGQVGAALTLSLFVSFGLWWGAPLVIAVAIGLLIAFHVSLPLKLSAETGSDTTDPSAKGPGRRRLPARVWLYAIVTFAYGAIEGTFGNWTPIYLEQSVGLTLASAALGLSLFWASVTVGRVIFAVLAVRLDTKPLYYVTPFVVGAVFLLWPELDGRAANYAAIIIAGLALSFFFPYSVSLASAKYPLLLAAVSGSLVAGLQLGNGISANFVGFASQLSALSTVIRFSVVYAVLMAAVVIYLGVTGRRAKLNEELPCVVLPCVQTNKKQS